MKVIHLDGEKYFGGGQNQVYLLNKYLLKKGVKSIVSCPRGSFLFEKLKKENYKVIPLSIKEILREIEEKEVILHVHSGKALLISHILKILKPKVKVVFTRRITKKIKFFFIRKFLIDAIICISEEIKKNFENFKKEKIFVIYSGVEMEEKEILKPPWYDEKKFIVGNIAHLLPYKDHITLINGFFEFLNYFPDSYLIIIGEGKEKKKILKRIKELKIDNKVFLTGFLKDAKEYIKYFSVFVITSKEDEGLCSSIIDAFIRKVPVIATDTGGIKELVKNMETGILIEKKNPSALKNALIKIKEDKKLREKIINNAYEFSKNFSALKMAEENLKVYENLLK
ncbi:MAG: glycosyltransferase family 4 protein [candidate division WOR-3 bacterium]